MNPNTNRIAESIQRIISVPNKGIRMVALRNVPSKLPMVEMAYIRPDNLPASSMLFKISFKAYGNIAAKQNAGKENKATEASEDFTIKGNARLPKIAKALFFRILVMAIPSAAPKRKYESRLSVGLLSAQRPPR